MKKTIYFLILPLVVVSGLVLSFAPFAYCSDVNRDFKNETKPSQKPISMNSPKSALEQRKKWEASPDGIKYKEWEVSLEGQKVHASHDKIKMYLKDFADMEAVVTSVTFQRENATPSGPKWLIVSINGETYMMQFSPKDFQRFHNLKVNDKIIVRSRSAGYSHNHPYLIVSGDYIAQDNEVLFKRDFSKNNGC